MCSSEHWTVMSEERDQPAVSFRHNVTGTRVSSLAITQAGAGQNMGGWQEVNTGSNKQKIMYFDEKVDPSQAVIPCSDVMK